MLAGRWTLDEARAEARAHQAQHQHGLSPSATSIAARQSNLHRNLGPAQSQPQPQTAAVFDFDLANLDLVRSPALLPIVARPSTFHPLCLATAPEPTDRRSTRLAQHDHDNDHDCASESTSPS